MNEAEAIYLIVSRLFIVRLFLRGKFKTEKGVIQQYLVVAAFFLCVVGVTFGKAAWLSKKGWASFPKSLGFAALTNAIGFIIGFFALFVAVTILVMSALGNKNDTFAVGENGLLVMEILAVLTLPALLIISKRIFLPILKMQTGKAA